MSDKASRGSYFDGIRFCVVGLGDSSYYTYQTVAVAIESQLESFGAKKILPMHKIDNSIDLEAFTNFKVALFEQVNALKNSIENQEAQTPPKLNASKSSSELLMGVSASMKLTTSSASVKTDSYQNNPLFDYLVGSFDSCKKLFRKTPPKPEFQNSEDYYHGESNLYKITIDISNAKNVANHQIQAGDYIAILPVTSDAAVTSFAKRLGVENVDQQIELEPCNHSLDSQSQLVGKIRYLTFRQALKYCIDINAVITKPFWNYLLNRASNNRQEILAVAIIIFIFQCSSSDFVEIPHFEP